MVTSEPNVFTLMFRNVSEKANVWGTGESSDLPICATKCWMFMGWGVGCKEERGVAG